MTSTSKHIKALFERDGPWCHFCCPFCEVGYRVDSIAPLDPETEARRQALLGKSK